MSGSRAPPGLSPARVVKLSAKINSRFLTGPSALFGMTKVLFWWMALRCAEAPLFHGSAGGGGDFGEVQDKVKGKINVKGSGQSLP